MGLPCNVEHGACPDLRVDRIRGDRGSDCSRGDSRPLESSGRPIRSPATGDEHRVRIDIPNGIEFDIAEIGSGTTKTMASIVLDLKDTYRQFNVLRHSGKGVVH